MKKNIIQIAIFVIALMNSSLVNAQTWIEVTGGTFTMGEKGVSTNQSWHYSPKHEVTVNSFEITATEITIAQYATFLNEYDPTGTNKVSEGSYTDAPLCASSPYGVQWSGTEWTYNTNYANLPMCAVTWFGADAYCRWAGGRLPGETEWEYAARGGEQSKGYTFSGSSKATDVAIHYYNKTAQNARVASLKANELGIYDMSGNVAEWCADKYGYYSDHTYLPGSGSSDGVAHVIRGGHRNSPESDITISFRDCMADSTTSTSVGFRMVKENTNSITEQQKFSITLSPIPARDVLYVNGSEHAKSLSIITLDGRVLTNYPSEVPAQLNVSNLAVGYYIVRIETEDSKTPLFIKVLKE